MKDAVYYNPTKIFFGEDAQRNVGKAVFETGAKKVLLHYGSDRVIHNGLLPQIEEDMEKEGLTAIRFGGVEPNPKAELVYEGIRLLRDKQIEFIVAVGGGSVIDSAKAMAVGSVYQGDFWDFYVGKAVPKKALPVAVVLTIPAAGSESSNSSVITNASLGYKRFLDSDLIRPVFAALNPRFTYSLSPYQTSCGIVDAFAHVCERYFTREEGVRLTDTLCEGVMRTLVYYGRRVQSEPDNYAVRAEIMWACKVAHDGSLGVGRQEDWASHMIEHEISAENDMAHGAGLAVIMPAWMKYVSGRYPGKFARMAEQVFGIEDCGDRADMARKGILAYEAFLEELKMPGTLKEAGIKPESYEAIASRCVEFGGSVGNYVKIEKSDVLNILKLAEKKGF